MIAAALLSAPVKIKLEAWRSDRWDDRLVREAGSSVFASATNLALVLLLLGAAIWVSRRARTARARRALGLLAAVLWGCSIAAYLLAGGSRGPAEAASVYAWEGALAALLALGLSAGRREVVPRDGLLAALALSAAPILFALGRVPPRIHFEEMVIGLWCRWAAEGRMPELFWTGYSGIPLLNFAVKGGILAMAESLGVDSLTGLRLSSAAVALGALLATGLLARELVPGSMGAPLAVLFVGSNHLFLHYARQGIHIVDPTLAMAATALGVVRGLRGAGAGWSLFGGVVAGLAVQDYAPARAAPLLAFAATGLAAAARLVGRREALVLVLLFAAGFAVALGPLALVLAAPGTLGTRESDIVAFDGRDLLTGDGAAWRRLGSNLLETARLHSVASDRDPHYGSGRPYVAPLLMPLLLAGAASLASRERRLALIVLGSWILLVLGLGSVVMIETLNRRTIGLLPALGVLFASGCSAALARARRPALVAAAIVALALPAFVLDVRSVLTVYPRLFPVDLATGVALCAREDAGRPLVAIVRPELDQGSYLLRFLAPDAELAFVGPTALLPPGDVLVSARHAALALALAAERGASLERPFALPAGWDAWARGESKPGAMELSRCPPVLVRRAAGGPVAAP